MSDTSAPVPPSPATPSSSAKVVGVALATTGGIAISAGTLGDFAIWAIHGMPNPAPSSANIILGTAIITGLHLLSKIGSATVARYFPPPSGASGK